MKNDIILRVKNLTKWFPLRKGLLATFFGKEEYVRAVDGVSYDVRKGEILCLVGESGCGKTTTGKVSIRLIEPTGGEIDFYGRDIVALGKDEIRKLRCEMQIIFQDPYESLDPRVNVYDALAEPLIVHELASSKEEERARVFKALEDVRLVPPEQFAKRYPHELSGGQRQRVAVARALILQPKFIVADEPVSMLDASIRTEISNLLTDLQKKYDLTYLYITHDIAQARYIGSRVMVMYLGKIVEKGLMEDVLMDPLHPYTKALISNVPVPDPAVKRERILISGDTPTPVKVPSGCRFHPRCPHMKDLCSDEEPLLIESDETKEHFVACHYSMDLRGKK